jgi:hypothetical protein
MPPSPSPSPSPSTPNTPIAVVCPFHLSISSNFLSPSKVGVSAEFPSGQQDHNLDYASFWPFLLDKREAFSPIPSDRFNIEACVLHETAHPPRLHTIPAGSPTSLLPSPAHSSRNQHYLTPSSSASPRQMLPRSPSPPAN